MVSFSCENCGDVLTKKKLDPHRNQCRGASYTCIDCMVHFQGTDYRAHTSCMTEAQKYQGALYREKEKGKKGEKRKSMQGGSSQSQAMVPRNAYVEDAPDDGSQAVAVIDVPPRAPTPPPAAASLPEPENVNVFDFLVSEPTPNGKLAADVERKMLADSQDSMYANGYGSNSQYSQYSNGDGTKYMSHGFSYGDAPVEPSFERYDSWHNLTDSQGTPLMPPPFTTPAPKKEKREKGEKSDKKRKRTQVDDLDLSAAKRPVSRDETMGEAPTSVGASASRVLHSGLTGGLHKLVTDPDFYEDRIDAGPTPISPIKRSKRGDRSEVSTSTAKDDKRKSSYTSYSTRTVSGTSSSRHDRERDRETYHDDRHRSSRRQRTPSSSPEPPRKSKTKTIEYPSQRAASVQPSVDNAVGQHFSSRADHFLSFINKGPDSERGLSINKALKRYHREVGVRGGDEKEEEDKELWKMLRLRRNDRGEIVVFV